MEQKDIAAVVLSSLSLLVSVVTACLGFVYWRHQCKQHAKEEASRIEQKAKEEASKMEQHVLDVKSDYSRTNVDSSVEVVGDVVKHNASTPHRLWDLLFNAQAAINTCDGSLSRRELLQHMRRVDKYWDDVVDQHSRGKLPGFFKPGGGWLAKAENYRCLFEPLFIANYCQFEPTPYLDAAADKRPKRYWYIQQQWAELNPNRPQRDSTSWARAYQQQVEQDQAHTMEGTPPVL